MLKNQKGIIPWWVLVVVMLSCAFMLFIYFPKEREHTAEKIKVLLEQPRIETAAENIAANEAEKKPDIKVAPGLWTAQPKDNFKMELALGADSHFRTTVGIRGDGKMLARETASGDYHIKGETIVFKVIDGAKGIFPSSGRVCARLNGKDQLILVTDNEMTFLSSDGLKAKMAEDEKGTFLYAFNNAPIFLKIGFALAIISVGGIFALKSMRV